MVSCPKWGINRWPLDGLDRQILCGEEQRKPKLKNKALVRHMHWIGYPESFSVSTHELQSLNRLIFRFRSPVPRLSSPHNEKLWRQLIFENFSRPVFYTVLPCCIETLSSTSWFDFAQVYISLQSVGNLSDGIYPLGTRNVCANPSHSLLMCLSDQTDVAISDAYHTSRKMTGVLTKRANGMKVLHCKNKSSNV